MKQKPTIGRIVIFHPGVNDKEASSNGATEVPAVIVRVWNDTCVNLKVLTDGPTDLWRTSVTTGPTVPNQEDSYWSWPARN